MGITTKTQSNPSAGAEAVITVPGGKWWRVRSVHLKLVTSATAANRLLRLIIDDGVNPLFKVPNDVNHVASQTTEYSYANGVVAEAAQGATAAARLYSIPELALGPGFRILTVTAALQAADQFSEIALLIEEFAGDPTLIIRGGFVV
jgi:hypothetical protein